MRAIVMNGTGGREMLEYPELIEHRLQEAWADFLLAVLQRRKTIAVVQPSMTALAVPGIERDSHAAPAAKPPDFSFEFVAGRRCISHIYVRISRWGLAGAPWNRALAQRRTSSFRDLWKEGWPLRRVTSREGGLPVAKRVKGLSKDLRHCSSGSSRFPESTRVLGKLQGSTMTPQRREYTPEASGIK